MFKGYFTNILYQNKFGCVNDIDEPKCMTTHSYSEHCCNLITAYIKAFIKANYWFTWSDVKTGVRRAKLLRLDHCVQASAASLLACPKLVQCSQSAVMNIYQQSSKKGQTTNQLIDSQRL